MDIDKQSRAYKAWYNAQRRCDDTTGSCYHLYGGRGITFAPEWRDFAVFHAELGDCPDGLSLERVNNMKGYQPGNCIWATPQAQQLNKRTNVHYTFDGMTQTLSQWAKQLGMNPGTVSKRLKRGWFIWRGQLREG